MVKKKKIVLPEKQYITSFTPCVRRGTFIRILFQNTTICQFWKGKYYFCYKIHSEESLGRALHKYNYCLTHRAIQ